MDAAPVAAASLAPAARRRLREVWRSAGWPWLDPLEAELIAAGLLARCEPQQPASRVRLTDHGIAALSASRQRHRTALSGHEDLVERVALAMHRDGRLVWRGLSLRVPVEAPPTTDGDDEAAPEPQPSIRPAMLNGFAEADTAATERRTWAIAMPDVFSLRPSTLQAGLLPIAHEVKVRRADLLSDLRRPAKGLAYRALASQSWYVLAEGIGEADEIPAWHGVLLARADGRLEVLRAAPRRSLQPGLALWIALARADRCRFDDEPDAQPGLAAFDELDDLGGRPSPEA